MFFFYCIYIVKIIALFCLNFELLPLYSQGKAFTAVEPGTNLNDLCLVPGSGLMFMANEAPKVLTYYIPVSIIMI